MVRARYFAGIFVATIVLVAIGRLFLTARRYEARAVLATVSSARMSGSVSGLGALSQLAGVLPSDVASPELVAQVLTSRRVLLAIAAAPMGGMSAERVIDRAVGGRKQLDVDHVEREMRKLISVTFDRRTGLLQIVAQHRDTALARQLVALDIRIGGDAFTEILRSQATAQREGQEARVRLTETNLRAAERALVAFLNENRAVAPYSLAALEQQRLQREISVAQEAYTSAVTAQEAAYARQLEQTPAVVIVDPVPPQLTPVPRYTVFYAGAAAVAVTFLFVTLTLVRERLASLDTDGSADAARFLEAFQGTPIIGRLARRPTR